MTFLNRRKIFYSLKTIVGWKINPNLYQAHKNSKFCMPKRSKFLNFLEDKFKMTHFGTVSNRVWIKQKRELSKMHWTDIFYKQMFRARPDDRDQTKNRITKSWNSINTKSPQNLATFYCQTKNPSKKSKIYTKTADRMFD